MIRKNRRELNSYSPSKYIGCKKISKRACALLRAQALFVDGGRAQMGKMCGTLLEYKERCRGMEANMMNDRNILLIL